MKVRISCKRPRYAVGEFTLSSLEEVYDWLAKIKGFASGGIGPWLLGLAKDGYLGRSISAREDIEIQSDTHDYLLAQDVAKETGLLGALDRVSGDRPVALEFARETDRRLSFPAVPVLDLRLALHGRGGDPFPGES